MSWTRYLFSEASRKGRLNGSRLPCCVVWYRAKVDLGEGEKNSSTVSKILGEGYFSPREASGGGVKALNVGDNVRSRVFVVFISSEQRKAGRPLASSHVHHTRTWNPRAAMSRKVELICHNPSQPCSRQEITKHEGVLMSFEPFRLQLLLMHACTTVLSGCDLFGS
jgi:hypothetical protein